MPERTPKLLVVDDDPRLRDLLRRYLGENGFQVFVADNGVTMNRLWLRERFDALILDLMMPGEDGLQILRRLREQKDTTPIIMLTARGSETDRVKGLNAGADDYIVKPFMPRELIARIQAVLRRYQFQSQTGEENQNVEVVCGPLTMNEASFEAKVDGEPLSLSAKEFKLLLVFAKNPERVYSREMLLSLVWDNAYVDERTVDVHMLRLRKQLQGTRAENLLQTVRGLGYRAHISE